MGKSEGTKEKLAFIRFWEEIREDCLEQKFTGGEIEFGIVAVSQWLQVMGSLLLLRNAEIFFLPAM